MYDEFSTFYIKYVKRQTFIFADNTSCTLRIFKMITFHLVNL